MMEIATGNMLWDTQASGYLRGKAKGAYAMGFILYMCLIYVSRSKKLQPFFYL